MRLGLQEIATSEDVLCSSALCSYSMSSRFIRSIVIHPATTPGVCLQLRPLGTYDVRTLQKKHHNYERNSSCFCCVRSDPWLHVVAHPPFGLQAPSQTSALPNAHSDIESRASAVIVVVNQQAQWMSVLFFLGVGICRHACGALVCNYISC